MGKNAITKFTSLILFIFIFFYFTSTLSTISSLRFFKKFSSLCISQVSKLALKIDNANDYKEDDKTCKTTVDCQRFHIISHLKFCLYGHHGNKGVIRKSTAFWQRSIIDYYMLRFNICETLTRNCPIVHV